MFNPCAVIPVYNHEAQLPQLVAKIADKLPVILVNDGSDSKCSAVIACLARGIESVFAVHRERNGGKGAAVKMGLRAAAALGYSHALQIDADGQHDADDIGKFLTLAEQHPDGLIAGFPVYEHSVPRLRLLSRYFTHVWVWINTLSLDIRDSMCGFRVYPVNSSCKLLDAHAMGDRMDFDIEFMVRWHWSRRPLMQIATRVTYPDGGRSHFRLWQDNLLISRMHARLFFGMLVRLPAALGKGVGRGVGNA
ncbi:MAG: glycosyltransferase family 2 protein [Pseudomonadales bacterium]